MSHETKILTHTLKKGLSEIKEAIIELAKSGGVTTQQFDTLLDVVRETFKKHERK